MCWLGPSHGRRKWTKLASILAAVASGRWVRGVGQRWLLVDVSEKLDLLRSLARYCGDVACDSTDQSLGRMDVDGGRMDFGGLVECPLPA